MTEDEHYSLLGKLVGDLQSLEFLLRGFLQKLPSARGMGMPPGTDLYSFPLGEELALCEMTSYDTLGVLIRKANAEMAKRGLPLVDEGLVAVRDALAHGRVSSATPDDTMRLLKFDKPDRGNRVRVVFNQQMTKEWFKGEIRRVRDAARAVLRAMPDDAEA